jgi:hypothetical protein
MDEEKRKTLEDAGYKEVDLYEWLGCDEEDIAAIEAKLEELKEKETKDDI